MIEYIIIGLLVIIIILIIILLLKGNNSLIERIGRVETTTIKELSDFRNYEDIHFDFSDRTYIFFGDNAQGKTNILEAVFLT